MADYVELIVYGPDGRRINVLGSEIALIGALANFFGEIGQVQYDFGSAHYLYDSSEHFPNDEFNELKRKIVTKKRGEQLSKYDKSHLKSVEEVIRDLLSTETSLDLSEHQFYDIHGSTRSALDLTLSSLVGFMSHRKIALPVPNWHFDQISENAHKKYKFNYFEALNEQQLVDGFKRAAEKDKVGILILAMPAVPLMYTLSQQAGKEMDAIALKHGIDIVVDDVLRGAQPMGERDSIARYFTNPYIVEGFSKRLGDHVFGNFSYVLAPSTGSQIPNSCKDQDCGLITGLSLEMALKYAAEPAIKELQLRNQKFDEGLGNYAPQGTVVKRPSVTHLTSLVEVPTNFRITMGEFQRKCYRKDIDISIPQEYYPNGFQASPLLDRSFRITVGRINAEDIYLGANLLGREISQYCR